jgi:tRNA(Ile)-lysidine synthase
MPFLRTLDTASGVLLIRPFLVVSRAQIRSYALEHGLSWVEDPSNAEPKFDRNFVRHEILPRIMQRFSGAPETLARAAQNLADAQTILDEVASTDAAGNAGSEGLSVAVLAAMSPPRARNLLRWFLEREGAALSSRDQLEEALRQALAARADANLRVKIGDRWLRRHRGRLSLEAEQPQLRAGWKVEWSGESSLQLPPGMGVICFERATGAGLSLKSLQSGRVVVRARGGSERMRIHPGRPSRTLKNLLRESAIPAWERDRLPLLFAGDLLVWVPGVGKDWRYCAAAGEAAVIPRWERA